MEAKRTKIVVMSLVALFVVFSSLSYVSAEEYEAMKGVNNANVMFDMRIDNPKSALDHTKLIHETYKELKAMGKNPVFVVVFMGGSAKLISSNRAAFSAEEQKYLKDLAGTISEMSKDGINFEVCLAAVHYFGVDPASIQSEFKHVANGWISEIGYQSRGYRLVPVY